MNVSMLVGEPPESTGAYFRLAFRNLADPLDDEFQKLATDVFLPPLEALQK
jgi:hypothetical protein